MTRPAQIFDLPAHGEILEAEINRLFAAGFSLIPLAGMDGKKRITNKTNRRFPLAAVHSKMLIKGSLTYGILLEEMLVVDCDEDNDRTRQYVQKRFGNSPIQTKTSRGCHHWFRFNGKQPKDIDEPDIKINFKSGPNMFVVGPHSLRPDGGLYVPVGQQLVGVKSLPLFIDREQQTGWPGNRTKQPGKIAKGLRNNTLFRYAIEYARDADDFDELYENLIARRNIDCDEPDSFPNNDVLKIAKTVWGYRLDGRLAGPGGAVNTSHELFDTLSSIAGGADAYMLYGFLQKNHQGGRPGKWFAIDAVAISKSGLLPISRDNIRKATRLVCDLSVLRRKIVPNGLKGKYRYQLTGRGRGYSNYIMTESRHGGIQPNLEAYS